MLLTKYTHACVRLEKDGQVIVIDPGTFSEPESLQDAAAVLITHEHVDHVDTELLVAAQTGNPSLAVHTNADVVAQLDREGRDGTAGRRREHFLGGRLRCPRRRRRARRDLRRSPGLRERRLHR